MNYPGRSRFVSAFILLLVSLFAKSAGAAIAFVQRNYAVPQTVQTTVSVPFTSAQTAGNLNVVMVGWNDVTSHVLTVTDSRGNNYVRALAPTVQPGIQTQVIYYAAGIVASAANTNTVPGRPTPVVSVPGLPGVAVSVEFVATLPSAARDVGEERSP